MEKEFKRGHRYTKDDVSNLVIILNDGEKSSKELYQALKEKGLYQTESDSDSVRCQRVNSIMKFARTVLGEGAIQEIKKPLSGTGRGGSRSMRYFSLISSEEELNARIEAYKPAHYGGRRKKASTEETKEQEQVSTQPDPLHIKKTTLLRMTREIMDFFENIQNYSPRQFEDLLKRVSTSGFCSRNIIEVVISSFKEAEKGKIEEIESRYLA